MHWLCGMGGNTTETSRHVNSAIMCQLMVKTSYINNSQNQLKRSQNELKKPQNQLKKAQTQLKEIT